MLEGSNCIVLDLETLHSADDCKYCGVPLDQFDADSCASAEGHQTIGWNDKAALGLSIGCFWSYRTMSYTFFDVHNLAQVMYDLVTEHPLVVSFNGDSFDSQVMWTVNEKNLVAQRIVPIRPDMVPQTPWFTWWRASSYDILAEIWKANPAGKFTRGLNSLDAIAVANGLGAKTGHGAQAPRDWQAGKIAQVVNYCMFDVYLTRRLFEMILEDGSILRGDGRPLQLPRPRGFVNEQAGMVRVSELIRLDEEAAP